MPPRTAFVFGLGDANVLLVFSRESFPARSGFVNFGGIHIDAARVG
jgi:hypothetical protein